jgi:hypothetical protein
MLRTFVLLRYEWNLKYHSVYNITELLTDDKSYLFFYRKSPMISWIWLPTLASSCCTWIVFGMIASIILLSLIPLYLPERDIDPNISSISYPLCIHFHLYTHNLTLFRYSRYHCILRHRSE